MLAVCFIFTSFVFISPAFSAEYRADTYNPKYEGAGESSPVNKTPNISPNSVEFLFDNSHPMVEELIKEIKEKYGGKLDTMSAIIVDDKWEGIQYWVESVKASSTTNARYRTQHITFQIGDYKGIDSYGLYRTEAPEYLQPGGKWYDMSYVTSEYIKKLFQANHPDIYFSEIEPLFESEEYLYIGAVIEIVQGVNDDHVAWIDTHSQCRSIGSKHLPGSEGSMETRWQKVKIGGKAPDFYPTPEGETEWKESFKECAATYTGQAGDEITFNVNLYNSGKKGDTTDFKAVWEGQGDDPVHGWKGKNPPWDAGLVDVDKGDKKSFKVTVTVPDKATKLYFKSNTDGKTPASEINTDNNIMVIMIQPDGIDLKATTQDGSYSESPGVPVNVCVEFDLSRLDNQPMPVESVITWTGAATGSKSVTIYSTEARNQAVYNAGPGNENTAIEKIVEDSVLRVNFIGYAGNTYYITGDIMPKTANDVDLSNNTATAKITIYPRTAAGGVPDIPDMDIDEEIIVNITG